MSRRLYLVGIVVFSVVALAVLPNCTPSPGTYIAGKATGGGQIAKVDGRATFAFNGSSCEDPAAPTGRFNYNDKSTSAVTLFGKQGVMASGNIRTIMQCDTQGGCTNASGTCPFGGYFIGFDYTSKNPNNQGTGEGGACVVDGGEGKAAPADEAGIRFDTGPFAGYQAQGPVTGNVQGHLCD